MPDAAPTTDGDGVAATGCCSAGLVMVPEDADRSAVLRYLSGDGFEPLSQVEEKAGPGPARERSGPANGCEPDMEDIRPFKMTVSSAET